MRNVERRAFSYKIHFNEAGDLVIFRPGDGYVNEDEYVLIGFEQIDPFMEDLKAVISYRREWLDEESKAVGGA